jgi:hypothetical protein
LSTLTPALLLLLLSMLVLLGRVTGRLELATAWTAACCHHGRLCTDNQTRHKPWSVGIMCSSAASMGQLKITLCSFGVRRGHGLTRGTVRTDRRGRLLFRACGRPTGSRQSVCRHRSCPSCPPPPVHCHSSS